MFQWARSVDPSQPLTSGVWQGKWGEQQGRSTISDIQLGNADVITFHSYAEPAAFESRIGELSPLGRPIICTEYMARPQGSPSRESCPSRSAITLAPSIGVSSRERPRHTSRGIRGTTRTWRRRKCGFTTSYCPTDGRIGTAKFKRSGVWPAGPSVNQSQSSKHRTPAWTTAQRLRFSRLDHGFELGSNSVHKHSSRTLVEILRTGSESLPFASFRRVAGRSEQDYDLLRRFTHKLGLPGMPDEALQRWGV